MKIVFATNNKNKLTEIRSMLGGSGIKVLSLSDIGCHEDIIEDGKTLEENALIKAKYVYEKYHMSCFADDTGLEVEALGGEPGVYSARYAGGEGHDSEANMAKLLGKLNGISNRKARFRTVIALILAPSKPPLEEGLEATNVNDEAHLISSLPREGSVGASILDSLNGDCESSTLFEGIANGSIIEERRGGEGFGYDPIFQPDGYNQTFAELGLEVKNKISHRAKAVRKLVEYLKKELSKSS